MEKSNHYPKVSVVIPTLNEERNLPYVLPKLPPIVTEVVLVDGRSTDNTVEVARNLRPDIKVVYEKAKGKGNALRAGFAACTGDIIVMLDADGSADPNEIYVFVDALMNGYDFARGTRALKPGGSSDLTFMRNLGNKALNTVANVLFGTNFTDLCYGYNAFWRHCLQYFVIDCAGFEVETQLHLRVCKSKLKTVEVPSFEHSRIFGESNLSAMRDGWRVLKMIFNEWASGRETILDSRENAIVLGNLVTVSYEPEVELAS